MGKLTSAFEKAGTSAAYPYGAMNFILALAIYFRIAKTVNSCTRWRGIFKELSQDGGRDDYSKHLRASLFKKGLSNEPNLGRIHLTGQYRVPLKDPFTQIIPADRSRYG